MRISLFAKLFLWLWLVMLLIGGTFMLAQRYWPLAETLPAAEDMRDYAEEMQRLVQEDGAGAGFGYLRSLSRDSDLRFLLLRPDGHGPMVRRLPGDLREPLLALAEQPRESQGSVQGYRYTAVPVELQPGEPQLLVAVGSSRGLRELPGWLRLLIALSLTAALSAVLAAHLSRPLRRLSAASRQLASGDLSARVPHPGAGGDEITALARDFNVMAERLQWLVESRTRLLSDVSHELRSPLARMQVALELARRQAGGQAERPLDRMERDIGRLDELIGQVLQLARLERPGGASVTEPVDFSELLSACCEDAVFEADALGRQLLHAVEPGLALSGDDSLLRSMVDNTLRNALRYTPEGGRVRVHAEKAGREIRLTIEDEGPGVPPDQLDRIFEPFVRVSSARDRESGGYGLGLAIVRRAVEAHGGHVAAENRAEGGLRIRLTLPAAGAASH